MQRLGGVRHIVHKNLQRICRQTEGKLAGNGRGIKNTRGLRQEPGISVEGG